MGHPGVPMGPYRTFWGPFWGAVGDAVVSLQVTVLFAEQHIAVQLLGSLWGPLGHPGVSLGHSGVSLGSVLGCRW